MFISNYCKTYYLVTTNDLLYCKMLKLQICSVRNLMVTHAACGSDHTALLTLDGGVFTFGAGNYGQLGHGGGKNNEQNPKKVLELMGTEVSQVRPT